MPRPPARLTAAHAPRIPPRSFFYTARKNPKTATGKWAFRKVRRLPHVPPAPCPTCAWRPPAQYDPIVREHVIFKETKLESGRKR